MGSQIATGCSNFRVTSCLLLSGILKGDKTQTEKTTTKSKQPPSQTQANKKPQPPTNNKKTQNHFKTKFVIVSLPPLALSLNFFHGGEKTKHNLSTFADYKQFTPLKTEYGVEV